MRFVAGGTGLGERLKRGSGLLKVLLLGRLDLSRVHAEREGFHPETVHVGRDPSSRAQAPVVTLAQLFAGLDFEEKVLKEDDANLVKLLRKPLGVVATITPWNLRESQINSYVWNTIRASR